MSPPNAHRVRLGRTVIVALTMSVAGVWQAGAHPERSTKFPERAGSVPQYRAFGASLVVCAPQSRSAVRSMRGWPRRRNLRLLKRCGYREIQAAIDAADTGDRILVLPGRYTEPASRRRAETPRCSRMYERTTHGDARRKGPDRYAVPTYAYQRTCPNARNLVAIIGDEDGDGDCDTRCNLQLEGTGARPSDVVVVGDRRKSDVIHVDRADGFLMTNLTVQYGAFNGVNVIETDGFALVRVVSRWNQNYGVLTFTGDHGLYDRVTTHGNGHAGVYPGSAAERHEEVPGGRHPPAGTGTTRCLVGGDDHSIEMRGVNSYGNTYGYSGTAGNAVWVHHSRFHHNSTGMSTDSTASAHPGMPQDCARWEHNRIYANNLNVFAYPRQVQEDCALPFDDRRRPRTACPYFPAPVGTGIQIAGGVQNLVARNRIYDNWRSGVRLFIVPAPLRSERSPERIYDTSLGNRFVGNSFGSRPSGRPGPNGVDVWWDEAGSGNCWSGNHARNGLSSDPPGLQDEYPCDAGNPFMYGNLAKVAEQAPCLAYDPMTNLSPGCGWMRTPPDPETSAAGRRRP